MGIIPTRKNLELCDKVNASAFCRSVINLIIICIHWSPSIIDASTPLGQPKVTQSVTGVPSFQESPCRRDPLYLFKCLLRHVFQLQHANSMYNFYRRRLPVIMVKLRMAQHIGDAAKFVEQGRILNMHNIMHTTNLWSYIP